MVQWLRVHTPSAGDQVGSLVRELDLNDTTKVKDP